MPINTYERIRYTDETGGKTIILRNPIEVKILGAPCVSGIKVNVEGEEVAPRGVDSLQQIIDLKLVTKRTPLKFNNHDGTLEEIS